MIAHQQLAPAPEPRRVERVRTATRRRTRRTKRATHAPLIGVGVLTLAILVPLLLFVMFTANVTASNYALARAEHERTALMEETQRLDDRIARLQSPERLAALAAQLKMHDPHVYAVVSLPEPKTQARPSGFAFLGSWFSGKP